MLQTDTPEINFVAEQQSGEVQYHDYSVPLLDTFASVCVGYRRCRDFDVENKPGQDFVAVKGDVNYIVGVVADGVSQSFYGNIAAKAVGEWLIEMLWENRQQPLVDTVVKEI